MTPIHTVDAASPFCHGTGAGPERPVQIFRGSFAAEPVEGTMSDHSVLLIDTDLDSREICTLLLHHRDYRVVCATCETDGLDLARSERPTVIVTDVYTRTRDGWRIPELLKSDPATASIPVIVLSAYVLPEDRERALRSGADAFLAKPVDGRLLLAEVGRFCDRV